jgi:hypothetical protein
MGKKQDDKTNLIEGSKIIGNRYRLPRDAKEVAEILRSHTLKKGGADMSVEIVKDNDDDAFGDIPSITKEEAVEYIKSMTETTGCSTTDEYKEAISKGEVKNYSRAQLEIWEEMEQCLEELEKDE